MKLILLSGGSGKRLWPLSNESRSKQFLKLLKKDDGDYESMLQRVYSQIRYCMPKADVIISTGAKQKDSILNQLGHAVTILEEPSRRNTFPAILLSAAYLIFEQQTSLDEPVVILPVDPYAEIEYFETLRQMAQVVEQGTFPLVLMGIAPSYPSEKYGYIVPASSVHADSPTQVRSFVEKPSASVAEELIASGALWNGGVFACRLSYLAQHLHKNLNCSSFLDVMTQYDQLESTSFDYAVVEHETCIGMLPYHGYWRDLGTWNTLTGEMKDASMGRAILGEGAENTFVVNELSTPIVALGTKNLIIAASPDGILVSDLGKSSYMKPYVEHLGDTPMFEERRWGEYRIVEHTRQDDAETITKQALVHCGKTISFEHGISHKKIWVLTMGRANIEIDGVCHCACAGDSFQIAPFQKHSLHALTEVSLLSVEFMESD